MYYVWNINVYIDLNKYFKIVQRFGKIYFIKLLLFWVIIVIQLIMKYNIYFV